MSERRIPELDGVRGIAVAGVMLLHFNTTVAPSAGGLQRAVFGLLSFGWCGVDLFFVLSGFLITGILLNTREAPNYFQSFYARRCLRIFPIAYLSIGAWFWVVAPLFRHFHLPESFNGIPTGVTIPARDQIWFWLYLENWHIGQSPAAIGHFWSLAIEEQFYMAWPLVVILFARRLKAVCLLIIGVALALRGALSLSGSAGIVLYHNTFCRADELAAGALLAALIFEGIALGPLRLAAFIAVPLVCAIVVIERSPAFETPLMSVFGPSLLAASFAGLLSIVIAPNAALSTILRFRPLQALGKYSYAIYIFHYPIVLVLRQAIRPRFHAYWGQMIATQTSGFLITYLVALASWHLIEKRMLSLKGRFRAIVPVARARPC